VKRVEKAIVLSAGQGKRLLPLTETRPKCLVELSGRTLLAWQLHHLDEVGLREAVVVTGFGAEAVEAEIASLHLSHLKVRTLFNPFYSVADNLASCWLARAEFDRDVLLLNGDTLFEPAIAERLLSAAPAEITVTIDRKDAYDADDMKVLTDGARLLAIGKTIEDYDAESIGFLRFSAAGAQRFTTAAGQILRQPEGLRRWYLSVIDELSRSGGGVAVQTIEGLDWGEMDFLADVEANTVLTSRWTELAAQAAE
jgi:choline kinase